MPADQSPGVTGSVRPDLEDAQAFRGWIEWYATGAEYGLQHNLHLQARAELWGLVARPDPAFISVVGPEVTELQAAAGQLAAVQSSVAAPVVEVPELTQNLIDDVRTVSGLTYAQIASLYGISERAVAGWRSQTVPRHRSSLLQALRSVGLTLVGGLGPDGVASWLTSGRPTRLERIRQGDLEGVVAEARSYEDSPAT